MPTNLEQEERRQARTHKEMRWLIGVVAIGGIIALLANPERGALAPVLALIIIAGMIGAQIFFDTKSRKTAIRLDEEVRRGAEEAESRRRARFGD